LLILLNLFLSILHHITITVNVIVNLSNSFHFCKIFEYFILTYNLKTFCNIKMFLALYTDM
jgi:hypothetical protein